MKLPSHISPLIYGAEALVPLTSEVLDLLTKEDKYGEAYKMYRQDTENSPNAWVPRGLVSRQSCPEAQQFLSTAPTNKTKAVKPPQTDDQANCIAQSIALLKHTTDHVVEAPTGFGKSSPFGTKVVLFDGSVKQVQDITVEDVLIGPDSTPRKVYGVHKSWSPIYRITPTKGEPFECNDVHILSLKSTYSLQKNGAGSGGRMRGGEIVNISVLDYLKTSKNFKHLHKLWRAPEVEFPAQPVFDPYVVGLYLADGVQSGDTFCCGLEKMAALDYLETIVPVTDKQFRNGCWYYRTPSFNSLATTLTKDKARVIPSVYLQNSVAVRLQLLAGLLDGDGYLFKNCFEITCKDEQFKDQVLFLCRSLGLAAYAKLTEKGIKSTGFTGMYWVISISGDTDKIPTKIPKKQADTRGQVKDALVTGFKVEYVRDDWVYGFGLDQDHLYLLNDFTVTHNTYVGCAVAGELAQRTLIIVTKNDLIKGWKDTLIHLFGVDPAKIGHVQQDQCKYKGCNFVIAMIHSLVCREYDPEFYQYFGITIFDEVHRLGADYFAQACGKFPTALRLGLSATPKRGDGKEKLFEAHIGPVMVRGSWVPMAPKVLVKQTGWKVPVVSQRDDQDGVWKKLPMKVTPGRMMAVVKALASSKERNQEIAKFVKSAYDAGRTIVVMSDLIEDHLTPLFHFIVQAGVPGEHVGFYHGAIKKNELENVKNNKRVVLATYAMCSEGTNAPHWDTLVLATPRSNVKQAIGRILRLVPDKRQPVVLDLVDENSVLKSFYYSRLRQYYSVGGETLDV